MRAMTAAGSFYALHDVSYRYRMGTGSRGITASKKKALGQIMGYADNLEHARKNHFLRLYKLTFARCYIDNWHILLAAVQFHDGRIDQALKRLDHAIDLSLLPDLGRFCKWRYEKDRRARSGQEKQASVWKSKLFVSLTVAAWRGWYCIKENGLRYFLYRLMGQKRAQKGNSL